MTMNSANDHISHSDTNINPISPEKPYIKPAILLTTKEKVTLGRSRPNRPFRSHMATPPITDFVTSTNDGLSGNDIDANGDPMLRREPKDGIIRFASNNINGSNLSENALSIAQDIDTTDELGIDVMGLQETKTPWTPANIRLYNQQCQMAWPTGVRTTFSSAPVDYTDKNYQAGGTLLVTHGSLNGRVHHKDSDPLGRFCWMALRGQRDEGVLVISAYRTCHTASDDPGPWTAWHQQYSDLRRKGLLNPEPRHLILDDLTDLINEYRGKGYRPILMLDANEDWVRKSHQHQGDRLYDFMVAAQLIDPYYEKFKTAPRTFVNGPNRLDYILVDPALSHAIKHVGYIASYEGNMSDHTMAYVDFDEQALFKGIINRPTEIHCREFVIEQTDKKLLFTTMGRTLFNNHKIPERVMALAADFVATGATEENIAKYTKLDTEIIDLIVSAAKQTSRRKFGYSRSEELTTAGQLLILYKCLLSCKRRRQPLPPGCLKSAERLDEDLSFYDSISIRKLRKAVHAKRVSLWKVQKECEEKRINWIKGLAEDRTRAAGDVDWEAKMEHMKKTTIERQINRKLTAVTKGTHRQLDRIQIPTGDWYFSESSREIFHYDSGVWEAYPEQAQRLQRADQPTRYCTHHTLKVIPDDACPIKVDVTPTHISILEMLPRPDTIWKDVTNISEIEQYLILRNKRHLQQVDIEGGTSASDVMMKVRAEHGLSQFNEDIIAGKPIDTTDAPPEVVDWFKAIALPPDVQHPTVTGTITKQEYQDMFKVAREKTSSGGRVHYTLWKALAEQDDFAEFLCVMMSLPFLYGFANPRWCNAIDVMLEKKPGVRRIHQLRIIGLLEADFNTVLKLFFAKRMMSNAEALGLSDEQWGSRRNRSSIDAAMLKLLMFETARIKRATLAGAYYDLVANYDRILHSISNFIARRHNVARNVLRARALILAKMKRCVKTAMGTSNGTYSQHPDEPEIGGGVQGKGDVPADWCVQSDTLLRAHEAGAYGMCLENPTKTRRIKRCNTQFVDDDDGWASAPFDHETALSETMRRLQHDAQRWNNIVNIPGQTIAFHKTKWQILAWQAVRGDLEIVSSTDELLILKDNKGGHAVIEYLPPDQPNKGLGYLLCPDGNQTHQYEAIYKAIKDLCSRISGAQLSVRETRQALLQRLLPKLDYALHASFFTDKQCHNIDKQINAAFLPRMGLNRNTPRDLVHGPVAYGGLDIPDTYTRQTQLHAKYFLKQIRWNQTVAGDLLTTLDNIQLASGFVSPILEETNPKLDYIDNGWILDLRERLSKIGATMWTEESWQPKLQRDGDCSLMETFLCARTTRRERKLLRMALHWMRVITLADLADATGTHIPGERISGNWRARSTLEWPRQPRPPKKAFTVLRRVLRDTLCPEVSPWLPWYLDYTLAHPLGQWHNVPRHVIADCVRTEDHIYKYDEDVNLTFSFKIDGASGMFSPAGEVESVPDHAYPIACQFVDGNRLWTRKKYRVREIIPVTRNKPGIIHQNTLPPNVKHLRGASDGSLLEHERIMTAGWLLAADCDQMMTATFVISGISSLSSYRAELEGTFRLLKHIEYLNMTPEEVKHWCDNESAVTANNITETCPSMMIAPDADIILAILHHKRGITASVDCQHVLAHQDTRNRVSKEDKEREKKQEAKERRRRIREVDVGEGTHAPSPPSSPQHSTSDDPDTHLPSPHRELGPNDLSDEAQMNVACDGIAEEAAKDHISDPQAPDPLALQPPYEGSKAMLRIGDTWITSHYGREIRRASREPRIVAYCKKRHNWDDATMELINWEVIGRVRRRQKWKDFTNSMKIMHGWLPIMHNRGKFMSTKQCPGCECPDETFLHIFSCGNQLMKDALSEALENVYKSMLSTGIKRNIADWYHKCLLSGISGEPLTPPEGPEKLTKAVSDQIQIGTDKMLQGFLAKSWREALEESGCKSKLLNHHTLSLHRHVWTTLFQQLWDTRNYILHHTPNLYNKSEDGDLSKQLHWYRQNRHHVLGEADQRWADHSSQDIERMGRRTKRKWVQLLDKLRKAYDRDSELRTRGITPITDVFDRVTPSPEQAASIRAGRRKATTNPAKKVRKTIQTKLSWNGTAIQITKDTNRSKRRENARREERRRNYITSSERTQGQRQPVTIITPEKLPKTSAPSFGDAPRPPE